MRGDPESLADEELARFCANAPLEKALDPAVCFGTLAALAVLLPLALAGLFKTVFIGLALAVAAVFWALRLVGKPRRAYRRELAWRRGRAPFSRYVEEARMELAQGGADWIILFTIAVLPHGGFSWLRIILAEGPPASAKADLRISKEELPDCWVEGNLPEAVLQELQLLLKELDLAALTCMPAPVRDGAPCQLAILRREPEGLAVGRCNLGGLTDDLKQLPTAATCLKLASVVRNFSPHPEA